MSALVNSHTFDLHQIADWAARLRRAQGVEAARSALEALLRRHPTHAGLRELAGWHDPLWWHSFSFGGIRLERRGPRHLDFVLAVMADREFARRLKQIPSGLSYNDVEESLARDEAALLPEEKTIQWVVFRGDEPIGLSMFVNINFRHRITEQIMGVLPGHDVSFLVGDAYCASLLFAFNCLGLNKVQGLIYASNESIASQQERLGFRREGVLRKAVWIEESDRYEDLVQIALLRGEFVHNRVLQRHIRRQPHDRLLDELREISRDPMRSAPG